MPPRPNGDNLHNNETPDEPPPPYTEVASASEISAEVNFNRPYAALNQATQNPRPQSGPPPGPPPFPQRPQNQQNNPPPFPQRPQNQQNNHPPQQSQNHQNQQYQSNQRPPPNNRPQQSSVYPGNRNNTYNFQQSQPPPQRPQVPWTYPPNYYCYKCNNTGIKTKNGLTCQDCYARFAHQNANVYQSYPTFKPYAPSLFSFGSRTPQPPVPPGFAAPLVLQPGDPRIGGTLCGRCRGRGLLSDILGDYTCTTCKGVGRLL